MSKKLLFAVTIVCALAAQAELLDRPSGVKIGQRMTLRPYVSLSYDYNSNIDSGRKGKSTYGWSTDFGSDLDYRAENWRVTGRGFYRYNRSNSYRSEISNHSYGEALSFNWSNAQRDGKGWSLMLTEQYQKISQNDDMQNTDGRGLWRDRYQINVSGSAQKHVNEKIRVGVNGSYYLMDYCNNVDKYATLYGWKRWTAGGEAAYTLSKWFNLILTGNYQGYWQDNDRDRDTQWRKDGETSDGKKISSDSKGWTLHLGFSSWMTERISYRLTGGVSQFDYGGGAHKSENFTYSGSLNWTLSETWNTMFLASSYYMPSEREYGSSILAHQLSWGLAHSMIRGRLSGTLDLAYRYETHDYTTYAADDYDEHIITARAGLSYRLNRFLSAFGRVGYQAEFVDGGDVDGNEYDFKRWYASLGLRLQY